MPKSYKFNTKKRKEVLRLLSEGVSRSQAMESVGLHRSTLSATMRAEPDFAEMVEDAQMPCHEKVEAALYESAVGGNTAAQIFYLCNRMPGRWMSVNHLKVDGKLDIPTKITLNLGNAPSMEEEE